MTHEKDVLEDGVVRLTDMWHEPVSFRVTVAKDGNCRACHKQGQAFEFEWCTPKDMCGESYVGMYPILHSLRVLGDMRELGSSERNIRLYKCPSREIEFHIEATYKCNLCGNDLLIIMGEIEAKKIKNSDETIWVRVCSECFEKHQGKALVW